VSFREFCARPENRGMVEKTQAKEIRTAQRAHTNALAATFRERFLAAPLEAQRAMAPFLEVPLLRRVVQTLSNDERGDFGAWATNPRIIEMLQAAKESIASGNLNEEEATRLMIAFAKARARCCCAPHAAFAHYAHRTRGVCSCAALFFVPFTDTSCGAPRGGRQDPALNPEAEAYKERTALKARLGTEQLVGALNEQLQERSAGNACYRAGRFDDALAAYERALAILNFVAGVSAADTAELHKNKGTVLWNMAAAHLGRAEYCAAAARCTEALDTLPGLEVEHRVRLLLRRATAYGRRREFAAAEKDLAEVKELEPWNWEAEEAAARLRATRRGDMGAERAFAAAALSKGAGSKGAAKA
jgi:tetratricopeptide (TPR) repeat protein